MKRKESILLDILAAVLTVLIKKAVDRISELSGDGDDEEE